MKARPLRRAALLAAIAVLAGCGFTDLRLKLAPSAADARRGPLGEVAATSFVLRDLEDRRADSERVGYQKDVYGANKSDVLSASPVPELFRDAIAAELRANGHGVGVQGKYRIEGAVTLYWVDMQPGQSLMAIATAACALRIVDARSGVEIYAQEYTGHYTQPNAPGLARTYAEALRVALERMAWEVALDPKLVAALRARSG